MVDRHPAVIGHAVPEGGLMIDLTGMDRVHVDNVFHLNHNVPPSPS